ncbi:MAG TPA: dATP/dGTP diphosphohydrolase domain-containing protein [Mobilitalea sp.]|nr:dATP/dGTP diphosphohydrolase domain-containing protein [Mobilitalea sp.]
MLKDSGERREFESGAVRDISEGKGRCDLLPLEAIGTHLEDNILISIDKYIRSGDIEFLWFAIEQFSTNHFTDLYTGLLEVSKQYQEGAKKYADRNWEKGMPVHCYIDSGVRHYLKVLRGDTDEPHDRAFIWNMLGAIWTHTNKPELIDLPFVDNSKSNSFVHDKKFSDDALPRLSHFEFGTHNHGSVLSINHKAVPNE